MSRHPHDRDGPDHADLPSDPALRVRSLETLLVQKGLVDPAAVDTFIDVFQNDVGPRNGAKVVARAWFDPAYRDRLLDDATSAIAELGVTGLQGEHMIAVENTDTVHNLVVCTLCSCYPWAVLGIAPSWYKSLQYRSRAVRDPRSVLAEFGVRLPDGVQIRVWDSTAEVRYLVVPQRPGGTEGLTEAELADLVTRDAMIGTALVQAPGAASPADGAGKP